MNCRSCGFQLPPGAKACPNCGTRTSAYYSDGATAYDPTFVTHPSGPQAGSSPSYDPTLAASPSRTPPPPSTAYGSSASPPGPTSPGSADPYSALPPPLPPSTQQNPYTPPPPYVIPQTGPQPAYPPPLTPAGPQGQKPQRRFPTGIAVLLIALAVLIIAGSLLIYYATVYQPNQQHAQATATAIAQGTETAHAQATSTAQALARINATATAAAANPYTHSGTLVLSDPLSDNSKGVNWAEDPIVCGFMGGTYHVKEPNPNYINDCLANGTDYSNFAFEVQMQIVKGDGGGIIFRDQDTAQVYRSYALDVYQDGSYNLYKVNGSGSTIQTLTSSNSTAIKQGLNQSNLIAVVAEGNTITVYVNQQRITSITDSTFSHGKIGFEAAPSSSNGHPTEVAFSNAKVWTL